MTGRGEMPCSMIVTPQPEATEAEYEVLRAGVDAVIAAAFVQGVVDPLIYGIAWVHGIRITKAGMDGGADPAIGGMTLHVLQAAASHG